MELLNSAIEFATRAHSGQLRKMTFTPYILHPLEVACIISTITSSEEVMSAGLLHDTIEDCGVDPKEIKRLFGPRVSALVQSETEDKLSQRPPADTWYERKADSLLMLKHTQDLDVKILWLGDKLSNMRSFYREFLKSGDKIFSGLNQKDPKMQYWYYKTIAEYIPELSDTAAYEEYVELINKLFIDSGLVSFEDENGGAK